ncbi:MAG: rod shape-determining protein [Planctomycetes bacterium]|nr:rod shape-determining protein [Planctomycetota bacterium]
MSTETKTTAMPAATDEKKGVLYLGMDLGTSRTSIAASNGTRETVLSVVGYPKDIVSRKLLQRDVLFGDEAMRKRLSLNFYRPLEKGVIKFSEDGNQADAAEAKHNLKAAADLVRHAISLARPSKDELIYAVIGCPAQGSIRNKRAIIDAARDVVDSVMICSEPFAVAYGLDRLDDVLVIDIGAGTTDLCRMHGTMPEDSDQITIPMAGDYIDQQLAELLRARCSGASFTINMVKEIKERYSFVGEAADPVTVELPVNGKPTRFEITKEIRQACRSIIQPIVDALGKLVATFDPEFQSVLKNNVLLGGGGSQIRGLAVAIEQDMQARFGEGRVMQADEPIYGGANGALKIAHDMPPEFWEQLR